MIIHGLRAENILKYVSLELDAIPERGLFAISGENESGKSTIGETICFALFGRTFSLGEERIAKVIRWNQSRGSVAIEFTGRDAVRLKLERFIDAEGNHGARLAEAAGDAELATTPEGVAEALRERIGFGYEEFIESFYLAQREITAPHPHSHAVKVIAGVAPLEEASNQLAAEIDAEAAAIEAIEGEITDLERQIESLGIREGGLERLEREREERLDEERAQQELREEWEAVPGICGQSMGELDQAANGLLHADADNSYAGWGEQCDALGRCLDELDEQYADAEESENSRADLRGFIDDVRERRAAFDPVRRRVADRRHLLGRLLGESEGGDTPSLGARIAAAGRRMRSAARGRLLNRLFTLIFLLAGAAAGGAWWLLDWQPGRDESALLREWLGAQLPGWDALYYPWLPHAVAALGLLLFVCLIRGVGFTGRLRRLGEERRALESELKAVRAEAEALDAIDLRPLPEAVAYLKELEEAEIAAALEAFAKSAGAALLDKERLADQRERLATRVSAFESAMAQVSARATQEVAEIEREIVKLRDAIVDVDHRIEDEKARRRQAEELRTVINHFPPKIAAHRERIGVRELGRELLAGAFRHTTQRFNREIRALVAKTLPMLTEGRYEHLQIDEELRVRVFSNEKQDFLDLDEISSGTQRQIMLAVRLALSQELVEGAALGHQFLFLDEPFAFFDKSRMLSSLKVLPALSEELRQIWVISQEFPGEVAFDLHARCERRIDTLTVGG